MAFGLVLFMNYLNGATPNQFYMYALCVTFLVGAFFLGKQKPKAIKGTTIVRITVADLLNLNAPIEPVQRPIIKLPQ